MHLYDSCPDWIRTSGKCQIQILVPYLLATGQILLESFENYLKVIKPKIQATLGFKKVYDTDKRYFHSRKLSKTLIFIGLCQVRTGNLRINSSSLYTYWSQQPKIQFKHTTEK